MMAVHRFGRSGSPGNQSGLEYGFRVGCLFNGERFPILTIADSCSKICHGLLEVFVGQTCQRQAVGTTTQLADYKTTIGCIYVYAAY